MENHPEALKGIQRGLERETLRIDANGCLATTEHPIELGSPLTHKWITTDFAEALLEFITPIDGDIDHMLMLMRDMHRFTIRHLRDELMWPFSMPCYIDQKKEIILAQYGRSNVGLLKTLYREGLKNRYGSRMQMISGVHYNFSLPMAFWVMKHGKTNKEKISESYFCLIRNYYRFGWIIPYLFGASPSICSSFLEGRTTSSISFKKANFGMYYLPYATSLRLSNLGYSNKINFGITFNTLHEYVTELKRAIKTPSKKYKKIGLKKNGKRLQINNNLLQIENELYTSIRPKCVVRGDESISDSLAREGIEYIEVRCLDINPFSPIGVDKDQIYFLDIFMIWCVLIESPKISSDELHRIHVNWNRVILKGRKVGLTIGIGCKNLQVPLATVGKYLFYDLNRIAIMMDNVYGGDAYQKVCHKLIKYFDNPDLTFSARILRLMLKNGIIGTGCALAKNYRDSLLQEAYQVLSEADFISEREASIAHQKKIEESDKEPFEIFLYKKYI